MEKQKWNYRIKSAEFQFYFYQAEFRAFSGMEHYTKTSKLRFWTFKRCRPGGLGNDDEPPGYVPYNLLLRVLVMFSTQGLMRVLAVLII